MPLAQSPIHSVCPTMVNGMLPGLPWSWSLNVATSAPAYQLSMPPYFGAWPDGVVTAGLVVVGGADVDVPGGAVVVVGAGVELAQALTANVSRSANAMGYRALLIC